MATRKASQLLRPFLNHRGQPALRHDPGMLPRESLLIHKNKQRGPSLSPDHTQNAERTDFGQHLYIYSNIHTNQIIYSLSRAMRNRDAMKQLPFLGKKTKPVRLRKDMWLPFCLAYFPSPYAGLDAFKQLIEYKRLHETAYDLETIRHKHGDYAGQLMSIKERGKVLMDQKANSVADLAQILLHQEQGPPQKRIDKSNRRVARAKQLRTMQGDNVKMQPVDLEKELSGVEGVVLRWADLKDAEYAEAWPKDVQHEGLERHRYVAAWPPLEHLEAEDMATASL